MDISNDILQAELDAWEAHAEPNAIRYMRNKETYEIIRNAFHAGFMAAKGIPERSDDMTEEFTAAYNKWLAAYEHYNDDKLGAEEKLRAANDVSSTWDAVLAIKNDGDKIWDWEHRS